MLLKRASSRLALLMAAMSLLATRAAAQLPQISGGTRVRLAISEPSVTIQGVVFSQSPDTIFLASDGGVHAVPASSVAGVLVGGGRSHSAGAVKGGKLGALIVGGVGAVAFGSAYASYDGEKYPSDLLAFVGASAFTGAFYGAIIGAAVGAETWTPVYQSRVSLSFSSPRNGARGVGLSFNFSCPIGH